VQVATDYLEKNLKKIRLSLGKVQVLKQQPFISTGMMLIPMPDGLEALRNQTLVFQYLKLCLKSLLTRSRRVKD
jgi:hypothetical protein